MADASMRPFKIISIEPMCDPDSTTSRKNPWL
jgi:hypothetical protein